MRLAGPEHLLALQGFQTAESKAFQLEVTEGPLLQNLAGNALATNVLGAIFTAGALASPRGLSGIGEDGS